MTLWRIVAVTVLCIPVAAVIVALEPRAPHYHDEGRFLVQRYAYEAFPQWAADHPWLQCPQTIAELSPYTNRTHERDFWGTNLEMRCTPGMRLFVRSAGPDERFGTADDITSND